MPNISINEKKGMKRVMIFGTFDGIHNGHKSLISQARKQGDHLIAIVAKDNTVKKIKGRFPCIREEQRLKEIKEFADTAVLGYENDYYRIIKEIKPDIICLGYDQNSFDKGLSGLNIPVYRMQELEPEKYHSSILNVC